MSIEKRVIGKSGIEVSAMGIGCWAIGGPAFEKDGTPIGWGDVKDENSIAGLNAAIDMGITLFDTSNMYGTGHSESLIGQVIKGRRDKVVLSSKLSGRLLFTCALCRQGRHGGDPGDLRSSRRRGKNQDLRLVDG